MNFEEIANKFNELIKESTQESKKQVIELLSPMLTDESFTTEQKVFAYWNISDRYALLREHENTYQNHLKFKDFLKDKNENYKLMLICDATQKLSLICGGYEEFWNTLYFDIINNCKITKENYIIYFQALRTALYFRDNITEYQTVGKHALVKMQDFLKLYNDDSQYLWLEMIYFDCLIKYNSHFSLNNDSILNKSFESFKNLAIYLKIDEITKKESLKQYESNLLGTYEAWNSLKPIYIQARCVQNYIITLIDSGYYELAKKCFEFVGDKEFSSPYFRKKIEFLYP